MEIKYFLAIDIGASSGRHILGSIQNGKLVLEEIYRFKNGAKEENGKFVWDINGLFDSVKEGLKKCKEIGKIPYSVGIDTWGVDYALLDENDELISEVYSYRDQRTEKYMEELHGIISEDELYKRTGIQKQVYNTIYQLYEDKKSGKLAKAKSMLFTPDYLHFLLTGKKANEYTIASTSGLLNADTKDWDREILDKLSINSEIFSPLSVPGTVLGTFKEEIVKEIGFNTTVILPGSHDTASAVLAVPNANNPLYISSGTWSLMGVELDKSVTTSLAKEEGFTNEGGYGKTIRLLKNIMGLWMIQCVKKEYNDKYDFNDFVVEAKKVQGEPSVVEVNDMSFFAPKSMITAIKDYCKKTGQKVPETVGEIVLTIYVSLAKCYAKAVNGIEKITGKKYDAIHIVGGGCQNALLNELTAKYSNRKVVAGPVEATATGNIVCQMLSCGEIENVKTAKEIIKNSFGVKEIN